MTDIQTRIGLDRKRFKDNFKRAQKEARDEQVLMFHREEAWKYIIGKKLAPILAREEFIQTYLNADLSELNVQLLMDQKFEMHNFINLMFCVNFITYCYSEPKPNEDGSYEDTWEVNRDFIRQMFYPTEELMLHIERKCGDVGGRAWFRINFDFYPIEGSECKIVDMGMHTVSYEKRVIELQCDQEENNAQVDADLGW